MKNKNIWMITTAVVIIFRYQKVSTTSLFTGRAFTLRYSFNPGYRVRYLLIFPRYMELANVPVRNRIRITTRIMPVFLVDIPEKVVYTRIRRKRTPRKARIMLKDMKKLNEDRLNPSTDAPDLTFSLALA